LTDGAEEEGRIRDELDTLQATTKAELKKK